MDRRGFLRATGRGVLALLGASLLGGPAKAAKRRPNILLVITDDQGFGDVHLHGNEQIDTPVQDGIAAQGARFDRFYVCPVCAPTRAGLLTGRYHPRMGVSGTSRGLERMRTEEVTLAEILKGAGYATGGFGKWHNGHYYPEHPNAQGFEEFVGFCMGHWNGYMDPFLEHNGKPFRAKGYIVDVLTDYALEYIEAQRDRPFFCYVAYNVPHSPFLVPDSYFDKYKKRGLGNITASVYGMTECVDDNVGRLLKKLDELGLAGDTIVIFMSDNGPAKLNEEPRFNGNLRGGKGSVHEGGVRVPFFVRWPGRIQPGKIVRPIASYVDVLPTLLELAELPLPKAPALDGLSLAPLLSGDGAAQWPDRKIFTLHSGGPAAPLRAGAVRTQRWLAVKEPDRSRNNAPRNNASWQLYDIEADPGETRDLAGIETKVLADLRGAFEAWAADVLRDGLEVAPIPIGYPERPVVDVHCQDARFTGALGRTTGNNGYITGWRSTGAYPEWTLDVAAPGRYAISLLYTCPQRDIGATMRVTLGDQHLDAQVNEAYDPPFYPSPQRPVYKHYFEKPFTSMEIGAMQLKKGVITLRVQPRAIPGKIAMDLRAVRIKRIG